MEFKEYQEWAKKYDLFKSTGNYNTVAFVEKVLGLTGEAGETADKIKKILRDMIQYLNYLIQQSMNQMLLDMN